MRIWNNQLMRRRQREKALLQGLKRQLAWELEEFGKFAHLKGLEKDAELMFGLAEEARKVKA